MKAKFEFITGPPRPAVIDEIREARYKTNQKAIKAGTFGKVYAQGPDAGLLRVKPAREWMEQEYGQPAPRMLFGDFWVEGELCILFADTNLGKSILAVQIGNNLAQGCCIEPFNNSLPALTPVLYIDFELSAKQFESRYVDKLIGSYTFGETFYRAEFNPEADDPVLYEKFEDYLKSAIEHALLETRAKVLIIDNLTYMRSGTERAQDALPLMKHLKAMKTRYGLSVLALAHTPKRNPYHPLTVNDMQGSKMLINLADSAFAIGESHTVPGGRYLKQIKQRNACKMYGEENVCLCRINKYFNFLQFEFDGYAHEQDHLQKPGTDRALLKEKATELKEKGLSYRKISQQLNVGLATLHRMFN